MTVDSVLSAAAEKGIDEIGVLGHFRNRFVIQDLAYWTEPNPKFFDFLRNDIEAFGSNDMRVHIGAEVDINTIDGHVSINPAQASSIDFVMAGIHWPPTLPPLLDYIDLRESPARVLEAYCSYNAIPSEEFSIERIISDIFISMINAVSRNRFLDIMAHPAGFATQIGPYCIEMDVSDLSEKLADALAANGVAYELNDSTLREYSPEVLEEFVKPLVRTCAKRGVMFAIGSDAHRPKEVGELGLALRLKEELDISDDRFVTSLEMFPKRTA